MSSVAYFLVDGISLRRSEPGADGAESSWPRILLTLGPWPGRVTGSGSAEPLIHERVDSSGDAAAMSCRHRSGCGGMAGAGCAPIPKVADHDRRPPLVGGQRPTTSRSD